jgi:hypothetical protein
MTYLMFFTFPSLLRTSYTPRNCIADWFWLIIMTLELLGRDHMAFSGISTSGSCPTKYDGAKDLFMDSIGWPHEY